MFFDKSVERIDVASHALLRCQDLNCICFCILLGTASFLYVVNPFGRLSDAEGYVRRPLLRGSGWLNGTNNMRGLLGPYRGFWSP